MAEDKSKIELEKKTILATIEELKKAFEAGEITEEEYEDFKKHYDDALAKLGVERKEVVAPEKAKPKEAVPVEEAAPTKAPPEAVKPEGGAVDYSKLAWKDLQKLATERGLKLLGRGRTRETIEEELRRWDRGEPIAVEEAAAEEAPVEAGVEEELFLEMVEEAAEVGAIDPALKSGVETLKKELQSFNSKLSALKVRKKVSESTLNNLKANFEKKLIDEATYEKLSKKYEDEPKKYEDEIKEVSAQIASRKEVVVKYNELLKLQAERGDEVRKAGETLSEMEAEEKFVESTKLYILSEVKNHLSDMTEELGNLQRAMFNAGVALPDEASIKAAESEMRDEEKLAKELKAKLDNFQALIKSLDEEKKKGEIDAEAYSVLKSEYSKEGSRVKMRLSEIERTLRMKRAEVETYSSLKESADGCKTLIDSARKAFDAIWLEDQIGAKKGEVEANKKEIEALRKKASSDIKKAEGQIKDIIEKF